MANFAGWNSTALAWGPGGENNTVTVAVGGSQDRLWADSIRAPSSSSSGVNNTGNDYKALSLKWDSDSVNKLGKDYGTGEFSTAPGLTAFDTSSAFTAQSGPLASTTTTNAQSSLQDSTPKPSTRPYIWKYNK